MRGKARDMPGPVPPSRITPVRSRALSIPGAWVFTPPRFDDERGLFVAPYQQAEFVAAVGAPLRVAQSNHSVSRRGVIRGVHFADVPPGQAKYVYCAHGALLDVVVDVRVGSPTFGAHEAVRLDSDGFQAVYLAEGLGHAFCALTDHTVASYLCSTPYDPAVERTVSALDPALGLPWPAELTPVLSERDAAAPTLAEAAAAGLLPPFTG
jgi:dTDP-4-dehydrorhamnose 3,5-epimerase